MIPWHQETIVVLDFETTGISPEECMPVQVAAVRYEAGELTAKLSTLINPGVPIPEEASAIHGISDADVAPFPAPAAAIAGLKSIVEDAYPCGYNGAGYDRIIWDRFAPVLGDWLDPLVMVRHVDRFVRGKGRHKLGVTCKRWGVRLDNAHDALSDCLGTAGLLFSPRMRALLGDIPIEEVIERQEKRRAEQDAAFQAWLSKQPPK